MSTINYTGIEGYYYFALSGTGSLTINGELWPEKLTKDNMIVFQKSDPNIGSGTPKTFVIQGTITWFQCYETSQLVIEGSDLEYLDCNPNGKLSELNLSGQTNLRTLLCYSYSGSSGLTSLNVKGCSSLDTLYCNRQKITGLDVSGLTSLKTLNCSDNEINDLKLDRCTNLTTLSCDSNRLDFLDISTCLNLKDLSCRNNQFRSLQFNSASLREFAFGDQPFESVDLIGCPSLETINYFSNDSLKVLNLSNHTQFKNLRCVTFTNNLPSFLDASGCSSLETITMVSNNDRIEKMNINGCTSLRKIYHDWNG